MHYDHHNPVGLPPKQGLYDPQHEHDACGVGFVVNIKGKKSNEIVRQALTVLLNLTHRGATGAEPTTGDGAGLLMQLPHAFFKKACAGLDIQLPDPSAYGVGMVFLPQDESERRACEQHAAGVADRVVQFGARAHAPSDSRDRYS